MLTRRLAEALQWSNQAERKTALAREAVEIARRLRDSETLMDALYRSHVALSSPETAETRLSASTELLELTRQAKQPQFEMKARYLRIRDLLEIGRVDELRVEVDAYAQLVRQLQQQHVGISEAGFAMLALLDGRFDEAERLAIQALNLGRDRSDGLAAQAFAAQISAIRREQGRLHEMEPIIKSYVEQFPGLTFARCGLAFCYSESGRTEDARFHLDYLAKTDFAGVARDVSWLASMAMLSEVSAALNDQASARVLMGVLEPYESRNASLDMYVCYGPVSYYRGILAFSLSSYELAEQRFLSALESTKKMGLRPWHAHAQYRLAALLLQRNSSPKDRGNAFNLLASAMATAQSLGMKSLEAKLVHLAGPLETEVGAHSPSQICKSGIGR